MSIYFSISLIYHEKAEECFISLEKGIGQKKYKKVNKDEDNSIS